MKTEDRKDQIQVALQVFKKLENCLPFGHDDWFYYVKETARELSSTCGSRCNKYACVSDILSKRDDGTTGLSFNNYHEIAEIKRRQLYLNKNIRVTEKLMEKELTYTE